MSFYAKYRAPKGQWLIGGKNDGRTSRFGLKEEAELRLRQTIEINGGESHCTGEVAETFLPPEIFPHCFGHESQSIGGKCFGCGKVLTAEDAQEYQDTHSSTTLCIRIGDEDDYNMVGCSLKAAAKVLYDAGIKSPIQQCPGGLTTKGYRGNNYISLYWGDRNQNLVRQMNNVEFSILRSDLRDLLAKR